MAGKKAIKSNVPNISQIEDQIWALENIRVVIRQPHFLTTAPSGGKGYVFKRALARNNCLAHLHSRVLRTFGREVEFVVIKGDGSRLDVSPGNGRLSVPLSKIRDSYA